MARDSEARRPVVTLPRGKDGLFIEPSELTSEVQAELDRNRERFVQHFDYADEFCGDQESYDAQGDYNCGRCNQVEGNGCLLLEIKNIDRAAGSCEDWEREQTGDPEMRLHRKPPTAASYGIAANGKGFGCARCPYSKPAKNKDDRGRVHWCGEGGFHQTPTGCCSANGAPTVKRASWYK